MFFCAAAFVFAISFSFEKPFMAQAKLYDADCTYVELKNITKKWKQDFTDALNFSDSFIKKPSLLLYRKDRQHKQYFIFER